MNNQVIQYVWVLLLISFAGAINHNRYDCQDTSCLCDYENDFAKCRNIDHIPHFSNPIEELDLTNNAITNLKRSDFTDITSLKVLLLGFNNISRIHKDTFHDLKNLTYLDLNNNNIHGMDRNIFQKNTKLKHLYLNDNNRLNSSTFALPRSLEHINLFNTNSILSIRDLQELVNLRSYYGNICIRENCSSALELKITNQGANIDLPRTETEANQTITNLHTEEVDDFQFKILKIETKPDCITFVWISIALLLAIYLMGLVILLIWIIKQRGLLNYKQLAHE